MSHSASIRALFTLARVAALPGSRCGHMRPPHLGFARNAAQRPKIYRYPYSTGPRGVRVSPPGVRSRGSSAAKCSVSPHSSPFRIIALPRDATLRPFGPRCGSRNLLCPISDKRPCPRLPLRLLHLTSRRRSRAFRGSADRNRFFGSREEATEKVSLVPGLLLSRAGRCGRGFHIRNFRLRLRSGILRRDRHDLG